MDFQLDLGHLVPEAYRITHENGIVPGEQVRFYDEVLRRPTVDCTDYYASSINGDDVTIVRYVDFGEGQLESTVKARRLFATSPLLELYNGVEAEKSIALRKSNISADNPIHEFIINNQLDALSRACTLLQKKGPVSFNKIFVRLALAETKAQFLCGFCSLAAVKSCLKLLKQCAIERGVITADENDYITLTEAGVARSNVALPPEIERFL